MDDERETLPLFEFLRLVAAAQGRKKLSAVRAAVAMLTALDSHGTDGTSVIVRADLTAVELGISERQVWRHFGALVADGWFEQTQKPTRQKRGSKGRKARYRLTSPSVDLSDVPRSQRVTSPSVEVSDDKRLTSPGGTMSDEPGNRSEMPVNRLTLSELTSDIAERENGTVLQPECSPTDATNSQTAQSWGHTRETGGAA